MKELDVEPVHEPAGLGPRQRVRGHQPTIAKTEAPRLVEIFGDHLRARQAWRFVVDHDWGYAFGRHQQKLAAPVPGLLLDETRLDPHFAQDESDEAGMGAERMMVKGDHSDPGLGRVGTRAAAAPVGLGHRTRTDAALPVNSRLTRAATGVPAGG